MFNLCIIVEKVLLILQPAAFIFLFAVILQLQKLPFVCCHIATPEAPSCSLYGVSAVLVPVLFY